MSVRSQQTSSSSSLRPLGSSRRHHLCLPCVRIAMTQTILCIYGSFFLKSHSCFASFICSFCARSLYLSLSSLSLFPHLSLVSNLTFFQELKPTENASVILCREKIRPIYSLGPKNLYSMQYNLLKLL